MSKNKFYAVKIGRQTGIFPTWEECKKQVDHYQGACFKRFSSEKEARQYLGLAADFYAVKIGHVPGVYDTWAECKAQIENFEKPVFRKFPDKDTAEKWLSSDLSRTQGKSCRAYVDGSFNTDRVIYGYGVILLYGSSSFPFSGKGNDNRMISMRNVAGEIEGAMRAVREAIQMGFSEIQIYHDYEGISKWVTGEWQATKPGTIRYRKYMHEKGKEIDIHFTKVKAHSGNKYNDMADALAKEAAQIVRR